MKRNTIKDFTAYPDINVDGKTYIKTPSHAYYANESELAYLAGIIDGEGSIMIVRQCDSTKKNPSYGIHLSFASTDLPLCKWVQERFGGNIVYVKRSSLKWKDSYRWQIRSEGALQIIKGIFPFLILKKLKAQYAIVFQQERRKPGMKGITSEEIKRYEWFKLQISEAAHGTF